MASTPKPPQPPLAVGIKKAELVAYNRETAAQRIPTNIVDLTDQVLEFNYYESVFNNSVSATILVNDGIGLFYNFPMIGEEFLLVELERNPGDEQEGQGNQDEQNVIAMAFVIDSIQQIVPSDKGFEQTYVISLVSLPAYSDYRRTISLASPAISTDQFARQIYQQYIARPLFDLSHLSSGAYYVLSEQSRRPKRYDRFVTEKALTNIDSGPLIIPNLSPFKALNWLTSYAQAENSEHLQYLFFENQTGFHFRTVQDLINTSADVRRIEIDETGERLPLAQKYSARTEALRRTYRYYPDDVVRKKRSQQIGRTGDQDNLENAIIGVTFNNRIKTLDKIRRGYFENQIVDINPIDNVFSSTTLITDTYQSFLGNREKISPYVREKYNTNEYIDNVSVGGGNVGEANRVIYRMNRGQMKGREATGKGIISQAAFSQVDLNITIEGNMNLMAGDVINCIFPKLEGFTEDPENENEDPFLSGLYFISEVKHSVAFGKHSTTLRINRDAYTSRNTDDLKDVKFKYQQGQQ